VAIWRVLLWQGRRLYTLPVLASSDIVAFVSTTDAERARAFYAEVLGLHQVASTSYACVFATRNAVLRVTVTELVTPAPYTVLGWEVPDIRTVVRGLGERGVEFLRYQGMDQDELGVWRSPSGAQVAWFTDPDGNVLSVTEPTASTALS
jgi:catechol 2,3-dioxygenase-like lactoylglutathione lyase family enzyme